MDSCIADVKRAVGIFKGGLEKTWVREDFGQVVVGLEAKVFDSAIVDALGALKADVAGRRDKASLRFDAASRRVFYLAPDRTADGQLVDYKVLRDGLRQAGLRVA